MQVKIVVGNMLDYPAHYILVGSNVRGHCESPTSLVSQILDLMEPEELAEYKDDIKTVGRYGDVVFYQAKNTAPFNTILIGYPGTAHQESFEQVLENTIALMTILGFQLMKTIGLTLPLVGCSKTGLTIDEWAESFHKVFAKRGPQDPDFVGDINIVCKTEEQAEFIRKIISTSY